MNIPTTGEYPSRLIAEIERYLGVWSCSALSAASLRQAPGTRRAPCSERNGEGCESFSPSLRLVTSTPSLCRMRSGLGLKERSRVISQTPVAAPKANERHLAVSQAWESGPPAGIEAGFSPEVAPG
jgi:hypothetical protein